MIKFLVGCLIGTVLSASALASSVDDVKRFELALGFTPGQTRVIPALGATIKYLRTQRVSERIFAVYVEKLD